MGQAGAAPILKGLQEAVKRPCLRQNARGILAWTTWNNIIMQEILFVAVILLLGLGAWWSMVLFPRQRDFQKRQRFVRSLAKGDEVITAGGLIGRVTSLHDGVAMVELADGLEVRMIASSLLSPFDAEELARQSRRGREQKAAGQS